MAIYLYDVYLSLCLSISSYLHVYIYLGYLSLYLKMIQITQFRICISIYIFVYLSLCLSISMSIYLYVYLSLCLSISMSIYLFVYLVIYIYSPCLYLSLYFRMTQITLFKSCINSTSSKSV